MKSGVRWLLNAWGRQAKPVAGDYVALFGPGGAPQGQRVLRDLAAYCKQFETSFVPGDPHQTAFNEGARDVWLHIAELSGLAPDDFPKPPTTED